PYLEQGALYQRFYSLTANPPSYTALGGPSSDSNVNPLAAVIPTLLCPSDDLQRHQVQDLSGNIFGICAYRANAGYGNIHDNDNGVADVNNIPRRITDITDGTSSTLLLGEMSTHHDPLWAATFTAQGRDPTSDVTADETSPYYTSWAWRIQLGSADVVGKGLPMNWLIPSTSTSWVYPYRYGAYGYGSNHPGGANFASCDGSVHFLPNSVSTTMVGNITLLMALSTRAGGEVIPEGGY